MKFNQDIWRAIEEKVKAEIEAAITATVGEGGAVTSAIDDAITAAVGEGGAVTSAIAAHAELTTGVHGL